MALSFNENVIIESKSLKLYLFSCSYQKFYLDSSHLEYLIYQYDNQFEHIALFTIYNYFPDSDFYNQFKTNYKNIK